MCDFIGVVLLLDTEAGLAIVVSWGTRDESVRIRESPLVIKFVFVQSFVIFMWFVLVYSCLGRSISVVRLLLMIVDRQQQRVVGNNLCA